jgi:hypothetical protein
MYDNKNYDSHCESIKNESHSIFNRNNSQSSDIKIDIKSMKEKYQNSPNSYATKIKSLVDNLSTNNNTKSKHTYLEYLNKDNNTVYTKYEYGNTITDLKYISSIKEYNNTDSNKNDGSTSNRVNTGEYIKDNLNDMKYNAPKKDNFNSKFTKKDHIGGEEKRTNLIANKTAQDIKAKIEKYYKISHNSPMSIEKSTFKESTYSLTYKEKMNKNIDKPMNLKSYNVTLNKIKK